MTVPSVMIGVAIAPNATGAVLATSATAAAFIGLKPTATSITERDGHRRAEAGQRLDQRAEQKAMITAWIRWSSETDANERRSTAKCPVASVML